ncbi:MAG: DUF2807 domain-containing protein [Gammaproteobacteria bacterium]|nr:DUF2807 domain-containing protein [Gammaproteobacteria bacterium]
MQQTAERFAFTIVLISGLSACGGSGGGGGGGAAPVPDVAAVETVEYPVDNFSEISVRNSFDVIVQMGDSFKVSVTMDEDIADLVDVVRNGVRLEIGISRDFTGDIRADTMTAVVTLPLLNGIELSNSAVVAMAGFDQSFLEVTLSGNSVLEDATSRFDFVSARLNGSSQLLLETLPPLAAANVELAGSSLAIINMMVGGTLTAAVSGSAHLSYLGSDVSVQSSTAGDGSITNP